MADLTQRPTRSGATFEDAGTAYDAHAAGHERQGMAAKPPYLDPNLVSSQIIRAACEFDEAADPGHPDTIVISSKDLENIIFNRLYAIIEKDACE